MDGTELLTPRTRFVRWALFEPIDRRPFLETQGFWPQAVERWHGEGLPAHVRHHRDRAQFEPGDITIEQCFEMEGPRPRSSDAFHSNPYWPPFEEEVIEEDEQTRVIQDATGIIQRDVKFGRSLPQFLRFPVASRADWEAVKARLDPTCDERYAYARRTADDGINQRDDLIPYDLWGGYFFCRNLLGTETLSVMYYDEPDLIHDMMRQWVTFHVEHARRLTSIVDLDYVQFGEDVAYKNGPLISPTITRRFMTPYYRELIQELASLGFKVFILDSDGNVKAIMDQYIGAGINSFLPCEIAADMDPQWISDRFGGQCSMQGGMDKRALTGRKADIKAEVMRRTTGLLPTDGYLPGVDHATPSDVPFENYCYLVELLRNLT